MKTDVFSSLVATAEVSKFAGILSVALSQHHLVGFEIAQLKFQSNTCLLWLGSEGKSEVGSMWPLLRFPNLLAY